MKAQQKGLQNLFMDFSESWLWAISLILKKLWSKPKWTFLYAALQNLACCFYYQIAEFCHHDKFWVEALAWRKSGWNKLTKLQIEKIILLRDFSFNWVVCIRVQGRSHWRWGGGREAGDYVHPPTPTSSSKPTKVQQFPFQTSGILLLTGVQKLYDQKFHDFYHVCYIF